MIVECPGCKSRYDLTGRPPKSRARCRCGTIFELQAPSDWARSLACPNCGGGVAPTNHRCEFCDAALLVKACPRCFARVFHGAKHCDRCGANTLAPAQTDPDGNAVARRCPRCETPDLVSQLVGEVVLDECPQCHGVFVDQTALERILSERRQAQADAIRAAASQRVDGAAPQAQQPGGPMYVKCPDCDAHMNRRRFARGSAIVIDVCRHHGTWFDTNELTGVVAFAMEGGLERAAVKEAEAAKEEARALRAQAMALEARRGTGRSEGLSGFGNVGVGGYRSTSFLERLLRALGQRVERGW